MAVHPIHSVSDICYNISNNCNPRIDFMDSLLKQLIPSYILSTVVSTANLDKPKVKRFRMPLGCTEFTHCRISGSICKRNSIQCILYDFIHSGNIFKTGTSLLTCHTAVDYINWLSSNRFAKTKIFKISHSIGCTIPVCCPKMFSFGYIPYRFMPNGECPTSKSFYKIATRKPDKAGLKTCD